MTTIAGLVEKNPKNQSKLQESKGFPAVILAVNKYRVSDPKDKKRKVKAQILQGALNTLVSLTEKRNLSFLHELKNEGLEEALEILKGSTDKQMKKIVQNILGNLNEKSKRSSVLLKKFQKGESIEEGNVELNTVEE